MSDKKKELLKRLQQLRSFRSVGSVCDLLSAMTDVSVIFLSANKKRPFLKIQNVS